jgi:hypothetical protein
MRQWPKGGMNKDKVILRLLLIFPVDSQARDYYSHCVLLSTRQDLGSFFKLYVRRRRKNEIIGNMC